MHLLIHSMTRVVEGLKSLMGDSVEIVEIFVEVLLHLGVHHVRDVIVATKEVFPKSLSLNREE